MNKNYRNILCLIFITPLLLYYNDFRFIRKALEMPVYFTVRKGIFIVDKFTYEKIVQLSTSAVNLSSNKAAVFNR